MKKKFFLNIIAALLLLSPVKLLSQWAIMYADADSLVRTGADFIYNTEFDKAQNSFNQVIDKYPDQPAGYFLSAMIEWWKLTLERESEVFDDDFIKKINKVITVCDGLLEENPKDLKALFFKAGAIGYRARYYTQEKSWIKAATDGSEAFELMMECHKIAPGNHDIMLGTGIYNYFAEAIPEKYPFTKPMLFFLPPADKEIGILQLKAASERARYAAIEAKVVLLQIFYSFERDNSEAFKIAEELHNNYPQNAYFHRYYGRILVRLGRTQQFEKVWRDITIKALDNEFGYDRKTAREALYYVGYALMRQKKYKAALKYFYKCDEACRKIDDEPSGFMVETNLNIGKIYERQGKTKYAIMQYKKLLGMDEYNNSHKKAEARLNRLQN